MLEDRRAGVTLCPMHDRRYNTVLTLGGLGPGTTLVCETNFGLAPTLDLISLIFLSVNINWSTL